MRHERALDGIRLGRSVLVAGATLLAGQIGCARSELGASEPKLATGVRSVVVVHEPCDGSLGRVETIDVNADGEPEITIVYDGDRKLCRISDLNRDGVPDMFEYFDPSGELRRRETDYDGDGVANVIETFEEGRRVRAELDTTNRGRIDTWDAFDPSTGRRTLRERDTTGDGRVDQWWTYDGDRVTVAMDKSGSGKPDPTTVIALGGAGEPGEPPPPEAKASAASSGPSSGGDASSAPASPVEDAGAADGPRDGAAER